jgi:electron transfer flavoprotein alpha subunit
MSKILVYLHQELGKLPKSTLVAISAAQQLAASWGKSGIVGVACGPGSKEAANVALSFGLSSVWYSEDSALDKYLATPYAEAVSAAFAQAQADTIVAVATSTGKDLMPRVAGMIGAAQASDIVAINSDGSLKRPMYAGNVLADVVVESSKRVVTVRATAFQPAKAGAAAGGVVHELSVSFSQGVGEVVGYEFSKSERPSLGDAAVVVSGGRALQSSENFERYIFPLADALGAAVGASRAAVDSGYAPNDWQVGQTGKVVAPTLYVAVGLSGAIQHLAGMKDSKVIVAINKDADAPIFEVADYGLVGDLFEVAPQLTEAIKKVRGA